MVGLRAAMHVADNGGGHISSFIDEVTAYLGQSVGMGYRLLTPRETSKEQNGEEEVVLCSHEHSM